ncbi:MAG: hypothetical protein KAS32_16135 [Candidatus Peribacteraceae bacterium]|nr:hypothetical protein [Candidatus Peribacteraceae bacterium]
MKVLQQIQALKAFEKEVRTQEYHEIDRSIDELTEKVNMLDGCLSTKLDLIIQLLMEIPKDQQVQVIQQLTNTAHVVESTPKKNPILDIEEDDVGFIPEVDVSNMEMSSASSHKQSVSEVNLDGALSALDSMDEKPKSKKKNEQLRRKVEELNE